MQLREDGPFQIVERTNNNAYRLELLGENNVSSTFNISDLTLFCISDDSRKNLLKKWANNKSQDAFDPLSLPCKPMA